MVQRRTPRAREVSPPRPAAWIARQRSRATTARRPRDGDNNAGRVNGDNSVVIAGFGDGNTVTVIGDNCSATAQPGEGNTARGIGDGSGARTMTPNVIAGIDQPCRRVSRGRTPRHSLSFLRIKIARCTNR
jgi:endonuclease YncB( thermonuclease family)